MRVADGVHIVRGSFRMGPGMSISRTMTILEGDDGLVILNAVRMSDAGLAQLDRLGRVKHLVKLSDSHGIDEPFYADYYKPEVWALPGANLGGLTATRMLSDAGPIAGGAVLDYPNTAWRECSYFAPNGGGTLVSCDSLQNHADREGASVLARLVTPWMGFRGGLIIAPTWRKFQKVPAPRMKQTFAKVAERSFSNVVTGHGPAVTGGADARVRAAIESAAA
jgi:hypothetical protein